MGPAWADTLKAFCEVWAFCSEGPRLAALLGETRGPGEEISHGPAEDNVTLENVLQTKLDLTLIGSRAADFTEPRRVSTLRTYGRVGIGKVHVVKSIE